MNIKTNITDCGPFGMQWIAWLEDDESTTARADSESQAIANLREMID